MQSFTVLCAKFHTFLIQEKLLLSLEVIKLIFIRYFPQNYMLRKCLGREN